MRAVKIMLSSAVAKKTPVFISVRWESSRAHKSVSATRGGVSPRGSQGVRQAVRQASRTPGR